jgi:dephospho-CoA kinase
MGNMIIGLTGPYCSGKDTIADYLVRCKGFVHYSLSDELRKELARRGIETTRENLIKTGTELRRTQGNGVLAEMVLACCGEAENCVVTSIRHPAEVERLRVRKDFRLVNVDGAAAVRFARMLKRNRPGDARTFEEFARLESLESQSGGPGQQVKNCMSMASLVFVNDGDSLEELYRRVDELVLRSVR